MLRPGLVLATLPKGDGGGAHADRVTCLPKGDPGALADLAALGGGREGFAVIEKLADIEERHGVDDQGPPWSAEVRGCSEMYSYRE